MALETKTKTINGHQWQVTQWPGRHAMRMKVRLAKTLGPAVGAAASGASAGLDTDLADLDVAGIVSALVGRLDESDTLSLMQDMLHQSLVDNQDASSDAFFDQHFAGNFGELYKGLGFVLEVNFGSFFAAAADLMPTTRQVPSPDDSGTE